MRPVERPSRQQPTPDLVFVRRVNTYPEDVQDVISGFSSAFLEPDVAARVRRNPTEVKSFIGQLTTNGLPPGEIPFVLGYFGLSDPSTERKMK